MTKPNDSKKPGRATVVIKQELRNDDAYTIVEQGRYAGDNSGSVDWQALAISRYERLDDLQQQRDELLEALGYADSAFIDIRDATHKPEKVEGDLSERIQSVARAAAKITKAAIAAAEGTNQ